MMRRALVILAAVALLAGGCRPEGRQTDVAVFFTRSEGTAFTVQESERTVTARDTAERVRAAFEQLLAGPTADERGRGLSSAIPEGTRLRGVRLEDGVVWADFSRELESGGGSASMLGRFWQIVYTATQFPDFPQVRILIEGQAKATLGGEGVIIERPVARPAVPPRF